MWRPSKGDLGSSVLYFHLKKKKGWGEARNAGAQGRVWSLWGRPSYASSPAAPIMSVSLVRFRTVSQICIRKPAVMGLVGTGTHLTPN